MATHAIMFEWGMPIEGRELKALEEFMSAVAWFTELKSGGKIEDFASYGTLTGNLTERSGFALIQGSEQQMVELRQTEEYRLRINRMATIAHNIRVELLETGDEMPTRMQRYGRIVKDMTG